MSEEVGIEIIEVGTIQEAIDYFWKEEPEIIIEEPEQTEENPSD